MSFPIDFIATAPTLTQEQIEHRAGAVLSGGRGDPYGRMTKRDGGVFDFSDGTVWLDRLSPDTCTALFEAARASNTFLSVGDFAPLEIMGAKSKPPRQYGRSVLISSPAQLCATLRKDMAWRPPAVKPYPYYDYVAEDDPRPPPEPGGETRLTQDASGVAARCEDETRKELKGSHFAVARSLATQNPQWGVIWRADVGVDIPIPGSRLSCWLDRSTGKLARAKQPMEAWGSSSALAPLSGPDVVVSPDIPKWMEDGKTPPSSQTFIGLLFPPTPASH